MLAPIVPPASARILAGMEASVTPLVALAMLAGLVGTALPLFPGLPLVWGAALVYGLVQGFGTTGTVAFVLITVIAVLGMAASIVLPHRRVAAGGAPRSTIVAGVAGAIVGFFVIPVLGLPLGAVAAIMLAEYRRTGDQTAAWRSTRTMIAGFGLGIVVELGAGLAIVVVWAIWVLST